MWQLVINCYLLYSGHVMERIHDIKDQFDVADSLEKYCRMESQGDILIIDSRVMSVSGEVIEFNAFVPVNRNAHLVK